MDHYHPAAAELSIWLLISLTSLSPTTSTISAIKDLISARAESSSIHSPVRMDPAGIESGKQVDADDVWLKSNQGKLPDPYSSVDGG
jgi:hypothetical protein